MSPEKKSGKKPQFLVVPATCGNKMLPYVVKVTPELLEKIDQLERLHKIGELLKIPVDTISASDAHGDLYAAERFFDKGWMLKMSSGVPAALRKAGVEPTTCDHIEFCSGEIRWTFYVKFDQDSDLCRTDYVLLRELETFR